MNASKPSSLNNEVNYNNNATFTFLFPKCRKNAACKPTSGYYNEFKEGVLMDVENFGKQFSSARKKLGITQAELADKCNLNIRTIQRIENGHVTPRFYTIQIINDVLGTDYILPYDDDIGKEKIDEYRETFEKRKKFRLTTFSSAIILMIAIALLGFPTWELFGMPKHVWAPYFYLLMFAHIIGIALTWRCPGCNSLLGDAFNTRYCSYCGLRFYSRKGIE